MPHREVFLDEAARLASLRATGLYESAAEERFDRITRLAHKIFQVDAAAVCLVGAEDVWIKSLAGEALSEEVRAGELPCAEGERVPRGAASLCTLVVQAAELVVIEDTASDARITDHNGVRFYAGT